MSVEILTKEDLHAFRIQLLNDIKALLFIKQNANMEWLRSGEIRKVLKISAGTLQKLFYRNSDLEKLLDPGNRNSKGE